LCYNVKNLLWQSTFHIAQSNKLTFESSSKVFLGLNPKFRRGNGIVDREKLSFERAAVRYSLALIQNSEGAMAL